CDKGRFEGNVCLPYDTYDGPAADFSGHPYMFARFRRLAFQDGSARNEIMVRNQFGSEKTLLTVDTCEVLRFSNDSQYLASIGRRYLTLWSMKKMETVSTQQFPSLSSDPSDAAIPQQSVFSSNGMHLCIATNWFLRVWDFANDNIRLFSIFTSESNPAIACSP